MTPQPNAIFSPVDARPQEHVVVFSISRQTFAISASEVQEIRSADNLGGSVLEIERPALTKVRHIVERDSQSFCVVSGNVHFGLPVSRPANVLMLRGLPVAVLVDGIEEMAGIRALFELPPSFGGAERVWYRGLALLNGRVVPVVNPRGFLSEEDMRQLEDCIPKELSEKMTATQVAGAPA